MNCKIAKPLLAWYRVNGRCLPWREDSEPYHIYVAEIMLQQTQVDTVIPYYLRWMRHFPDIQVLAVAPEQDVLKTWEGLGYYSRARNMHRAAQIIMDKHSGIIPSDRKKLEELPGIGRYTSGAITSIAFGSDEPTLEGNIRRVLSRHFDISAIAGSSESEQKLWSLAEVCLPKGRAGEFNQALMDLGSMVCTTRKPVCNACPLNASCAAKALGVQEERPVRRERKPVPHYTVVAAVILRKEKVLITRRPPNGLLGGMWEFPGGKVEDGEDEQTALKREIHEELGVKIKVGKKIGTFMHAYTHFKVTLHAYYCILINGTPRVLQVSDLNWIGLTGLSEYPMGKLDRQISLSLIEKG